MFSTHIVSDEEGLRHWGWIGEAGCFDQDAIETIPAAHQPLDDAEQVAADGAADATVVHLEHFFIRIHDHIVVDADLAKLIDDDGVFLAMVSVRMRLRRVVLPASR